MNSSDHTNTVTKITQASYYKPTKNFTEARQNPLSTQRGEDFCLGKPLTDTSKSPLLKTHIWVTSETGLLKSVNLSKKTATNFYYGAQPTLADAFQKICSPSFNSVVGVTNDGIVKEFSDGNFKELYDTSVVDPCYIGEQPNSINKNYKNLVHV